MGDENFHFMNEQVWENAVVRIRHERINGSHWTYAVYRKDDDYTQGERVGMCDTLEQAKAFGISMIRRIQP